MGYSFLLSCFLFILPLTCQAELPFPIPKNTQSLPTRATMLTSQGSFELELFPEEAPITVRNFEYLSRKGFYNNLTFHKLTPGFAIVGGDPQANGLGGPGYNLPAEFSAIRHERGIVGMARKPSETNPERESNGSQFYICLDRAPHLDQNYTVFARVKSGMEVVEHLQAGDKILRVSVSK